MEGKRAIMIADNRAGLVGQLLIQIKKTNKGLFDEAIIVDYDYSIDDKKIMQSIMGCRFIEPNNALSEELLRIPSFKKFSLAMFARYEMFNLIHDYEFIMWMDTDVLIQGSLSNLIESTKGYDLAMLREDPVNKSYLNVDYMRTNFTTDIQGYKMNAYLYCSGIIILRNTIKQSCNYTDWCYEKTVEWAHILNLPDQGVLNALVQEFSINVKPIGDHGMYGAYPYVGRDCKNSVVIHSWGPNKFWSNYYLRIKYPQWKEYYEEWIKMGGSPISIKEDPKISVIIPCYKPDIHYFKECMTTLLNQKCDVGQYTDFEVIIVSEPFEEEPLKDFVKSLDDPRVSLYFNEKRLGIAASLNKAIRLTKGEYIARMDDDDLMNEYRLFKQSRYLDEHKKVTLCTSDYVYFGDMNEGRKMFEGELSRTWSLLTCPFDHPTIMFRRSFFVDNNLFYDESRGYVEDWELWQRAFHKGMKVGSIGEVLFYHRWHNGSAGQTDKTVIAMRQMIKANFKEIGMDVPDDDLYLFGPWNGKLTSEEQIRKLTEYFDKAKKLNSECKLYDEKALSKVFELRLNEAKTGDMSELKAVSLEQITKGVRVKKESRIKNKIKGVAGRLIKFFGWPFIKYHIRPVWDTYGLAYDINNKIKVLQDSSSSIESYLQYISVLTESNNELLKQNNDLEQENNRLLIKLNQNDCIDWSLRHKKKIVYVGTPEHHNIGDSAIAVGTLEFFRKNYDLPVIELSTYQLETNYPHLAEICSPDDIIMLQGGGNMGDRYPREEELRRCIISDFPDNKIVVLPQTICYDNKGDETYYGTNVYNNHKGLILFTRGLESYNFATSHYKDIIVKPMIDLACYLETHYNYERNGILLCLRDIGDESGLTKEEYEKVMKYVRDKDPDYEKTNNDYKGNIVQSKRHFIVYEELKRFSKHKVVVTDRLHGVIFSIITKTPCVVIRSYNQKITEYLGLIGKTNAIFYVDHNIDLITDKIEEAIIVEDPEYEYLKNNYFEEMKKEIDCVIKKQ